MLIEIKHNPSNLESMEIINEALSKRAFLILVLCCKVNYEGRARSKLGLGERTVLIKGDGSFIIHQDRNLEPINWQPPKTKLSVKLENDVIKIVGMRRKPKEQLELIISTVHLISYYFGSDTKDIELAGYEEDMRHMIMNNPDLIEKGFRPTSKEYQTPQGFIDIYGKDANGKIVIIELKSRKAGINAVKQLKRYINCFLDNKEFVRGILVAPSITDDARELLENNKMEYISLDPPKELKTKTTTTLDYFN
ncbi:MAG: Endonuclease NucS [Methanobacterium sp. PtaU1.Bin242]|nr:MAG: Endonuclease NucS [Methanobacterium sp. PtaU1.Bin242]